MFTTTGVPGELGDAPSCITAKRSSWLITTPAAACAGCSTATKLCVATLQIRTGPFGGPDWDVDDGGGTFAFPPASVARYRPSGLRIGACRARGSIQVDTSLPPGRL